MEEKIRNLEAEVRDMLDELNYLKEELKNKEKQESKEHKSLSDYRVYEKLEEDENYKFIDEINEIDEDVWDSSDYDKKILKFGNMYSIDTPNELLEREIKKRQLWFALEKHLKENNCLATNEDFKTGNSKEKFSCYYSFLSGNFIINSSYDCKANTIHSTDFIVLRNYMNTLTTEDIKIMFDVN